ncbi:unnamed protein product [Prunus armeniaca]
MQLIGRQEPSLANFPLSGGIALRFPELLRKSKAELQDIARQLMLQASQVNDDEDNESQSSSSCRPLSSSKKSPDCPLRWSDYPHGQDPNDDYPTYDLNSD